jgi:hypothetical protein
MRVFELNRETAKAVAGQPQGGDAIAEVAKGADLLETLQYYIPPHRVAGLHSARAVDGDTHRFQQMVREELAKR